MSTLSVCVSVWLVLHMVTQQPPWIRISNTDYVLCLLQHHLPSYLHSITMSATTDNNMTTPAVVVSDATATPEVKVGYFTLSSRRPLLPRSYTRTLRHYFKTLVEARYYCISSKSHIPLHSLYTYYHLYTVLGLEPY